MQSSKEEQGERRKPSSVINAKKQRKRAEWERLEIFQEIRDTKGTFHAKVGTLKERNSMDLTEAKDSKRWHEYREELSKNIIMTQTNMMLLSLTCSQTSWNVKSSGPQKASLRTFVIRKIQMKTTMKHFIPIRMAVIKKAIK